MLFTSSHPQHQLRLVGILLDHLVTRNLVAQFLGSVARQVLVVLGQTTVFVPLQQVVSTKLVLMNSSLWSAQAIVALKELGLKKRTSDTQRKELSDILNATTNIPQTPVSSSKGLTTAETQPFLSALSGFQKMYC